MHLPTIELLALAAPLTCALQVHSNGTGESVLAPPHEQPVRRVAIIGPSTLFLPLKPSYIFSCTPQPDPHHPTLLPVSSSIRPSPHLTHTPLLSFFSHTFTNPPPRRRCRRLLNRPPPHPIRTRRLHPPGHNRLRPVPLHRRPHHHRARLERRLDTHRTRRQYLRRSEPHSGTSSTRLQFKRRRGIISNPRCRRQKSGWGGSTRSRHI